MGLRPPSGSKAKATQMSAPKANNRRRSDSAVPSTPRERAAQHLDQTSPTNPNPETDALTTPTPQTHTKVCASTASLQVTYAILGTTQTP